MSIRPVIAVAALFALATTVLAAPQPQELDALRAEFEQKLKALQAEYEARLKALESRLQVAEAQSAQSNSITQVAANAEQRTPAATPATSANAFNPDISLILQGAYIDRARRAAD